MKEVSKNVPQQEAEEDVESDEELDNEDDGEEDIPKVPVTIITGFLGSGKSTLVNVSLEFFCFVFGPLI